MKLKEDVIGERRRLAKYIKRLQRFASVLVDLRRIHGWDFWVCFWAPFFSRFFPSFWTSQFS